MKCIQPEQGMRRWLVENEQGFTPQMCLLEYHDCLVNLNKQLGVFPLWITADSRIDYGPGILDYVTLLVADDKPPVFLLNKVRDMDDAAVSLLLKDLFTSLSPFYTCQIGVSKDNHPDAHHIFCLYLFAWNELSSWKTAMILFSPGLNSGSTRRSPGLLNSQQTIFFSSNSIFLRKTIRYSLTSSLSWPSM